MSRLSHRLLEVVQAVYGKVRSAWHETDSAAENYVLLVRERSDDYLLADESLPTVIR